MNDISLKRARESSANNEGGALKKQFIQPAQDVDALEASLGIIAYINSANRPIRGTLKHRWF